MACPLASWCLTLCDRTAPVVLWAADEPIFFLRFCADCLLCTRAIDRPPLTPPPPSPPHRKDFSQGDDEINKRGWKFDAGCGCRLFLASESAPPPPPPKELWAQGPARPPPTPTPPASHRQSRRYRGGQCLCIGRVGGGEGRLSRFSDSPQRPLPPPVARLWSGRVAMCPDNQLLGGGGGFVGGFISRGKFRVSN